MQYHWTYNYDISPYARQAWLEKIMTDTSIMAAPFNCIIALILIIGSCTNALAAPSGLTMALVAADNKTAVLKSWTPILEDLSKAIDVTVTPMAFDDYASVIWYLADNKAQIGWVGNKAAIEAVDRANAEIILQSRTQFGAGYYAHIIARKDAPYSSMKDVFRTPKDVIFGNGDPNSTSGFVVPNYYLFASKGISPKTIFKRVTNANHEGNFLAVAMGRVDIATNNSSSLSRYKTRHPHKFERIKVIWTSPRIPSDPIVVRKDLPEAIKERIIEFFTGYGQPAPDKTAAQVAREKANLETRQWVGLSRSDNSQLEPIRKLELYKMKMRVKQSDSLSEADKQKRLDALDTRLQELERH